MKIDLVNLANWQHTYRYAVLELARKPVGSLLMYDSEVGNLNNLRIFSAKLTNCISPCEASFILQVRLVRDFWDSYLGWKS